MVFIKEKHMKQKKNLRRQNFEGPDVFLTKGHIIPKGRCHNRKRHKRDTFANDML